MTDNYYGIYFDAGELEVDRHGNLLNPEVLWIVEFQYDEDTDALIAIRRVSENGEITDANPDLSCLNRYGEDDSPTIAEAMKWFDQWLEQNLEWRETSPSTYYEPAEYICIGITGYVDDEPRYHRFSHSWY